MTAYYNENEPYAAEWLRNLIRAGVIAHGVVDERSIEDVEPRELRPFTQCHFFAGIGIWSYALRQAGWPDDRPVWTGSCPCQPFASSGKKAGFDDERHLWPAWLHLIEECRPASILGEQVASKGADAWIDLVQADLEALGYAVGCVPFPAAGVGAPHIRDRTYLAAIGMGDGVGSRLERQRLRHSGKTGQRASTLRPTSEASEPSGLVHLHSDGRRKGREGVASEERNGFVRESTTGALVDLRRPGPTNSLWRDADWLFCRDGKWRPVEPGTLPLADGVTCRMEQVRAYGNGIVAQQAAEFIRIVMAYAP